MDKLQSTADRLSRELGEAIDDDPLAALPVIAELKRRTDDHLREAVRQAALTSSWREIADALGVSKQAAHQRFKEYAKEVTREMKTAHRAGDRARRDELAAGLKKAARELKGAR